MELYNEEDWHFDQEETEDGLFEMFKALGVITTYEENY